jgi:hypothetical protein
VELFDPKSTQFMIAAAALIGVLIAGYYVVRHLRHNLVEENLPAPSEVMDPLRKAYERGSMGSDEFERIQSLLGAGEPTGLEAELKAARKRKEEAARKVAQSERAEEVPPEPPPDPEPT